MKRVKDSLTPSAAAKELVISHQKLRYWVKAEEAGKLGGAGIKLSQPSRWNFRSCVPRTFD